MCSKKLAVYVPSNIPLWTQIQKGHLTLQSQVSDSPYASFPPTPDDRYLEYEIWVCNQESKSLPEFHLACAKHLLGKPNGYPDPILIEKPIWTTWAKYGKGINQDQVLDFSNKIISHGFEISQLELDDMWTTKYGDYEIDCHKFPDFSNMIEQLRNKGIPLTAWVHPFINLESKNASNKNLHKYFVQTASGEPGIINWWNGQGYIIDITNPDAVHWLREQLDGIKKHGVYSFKFDAARVGSKTQELPILIRTIDRASKWVEIGLQTLIPSSLNLSLHGYFWNLPDIIGGNGYGQFEAGEINTLPEDKELYIRWVQANTFLLTMQFSFCPWEFDDDTVKICQDLLKLRSKWVNYIKNECEKAVHSGIPVIRYSIIHKYSISFRPLWWHLETLEAYKCFDQFFVGDKLLIAPVVYQGVKTRDVFLPEGRWRDHKGTIVIGPHKITVETPLEVLPFYEKLSKED
uniref:Uncharacterized protein n=1 Tax=Acrobeloides nanus TaxID=290746 RepID=A0A914BYZ0_9BILA